MPKRHYSKILNLWTYAIIWGFVKQQVIFCSLNCFSNEKNISDFLRTKVLRRWKLLSKSLSFSLSGVLIQNYTNLLILTPHVSMVKLTRVPSRKIWYYNNWSFWSRDCQTGYMKTSLYVREGIRIANWFSYNRLTAVVPL